MMKSGFVGTLFNVVINQHLVPQGKDVPYFMKHFHKVSLRGPNGLYNCLILVCVRRYGGNYIPFTSA